MAGRVRNPLALSNYMEEAVNIHIPMFWLGLIVGVVGLFAIFLVSALIQQAGERRRNARILATLDAKDALREIEESETATQ